MRMFSARFAPNPRRAVAFAAEKGFTPAELEIVTLDLVAGDHKTADFRVKSPFAQVPTLQLDDGRTLTESRAICTYLEALRPEPNLMGRDAFEKGEIEMWDRRVELMIAMPLMLWVRHGHPVLQTLETGQSADFAERNRTQAMAMAQMLNTRLADVAFVAGDRFTIADITLLCGMDMAKMMKWRPGDDLPHLARWRAMMAERPSGQTPP
jgi:glutathione S-transferase